MYDGNNPSVNFYPWPNRQASYNCTTAMATALSPGSDPTKQYVVHSIHMMNINGTNNVIVEAEIDYLNANISLGCNIPVPANSGLELLKNPKILGPNQLIRMKANANSSAQATIAFAEVNDSRLFSSGLDVVNDNVFATLYSATAPTVLQSILLANDDNANDSVRVTLEWATSANAHKSFFCYDYTVGANSTIELLEAPKYLPDTDILRIRTSNPLRLEATVTGRRM